ncbi:MAG TPA: hypothetical protein VMJ90_08760 [Anaerolineales bacterium]|nr:hypothetical protein [Anaerolineales bacterium]
MTYKRLPIFALLLLTIAACGTSATPDLVEATRTPDPCLSQNLNQTINPVNDLQREFNDASELAANLPREQLQPSITDMQRIRREAEDQPIPPCLESLKSYQLAHMNSVIDTLIAFVGGADANTLNQGMAAARSEYDQYTFEMARLLGVTLVPATETTTPVP